MKQIEHTNNEQQMLASVQHPFIINLWGVFQDPGNLYMVMDFVPGGELFTLLRRSNVIVIASASMMKHANGIIFCLYVFSAFRILSRNSMQPRLHSHLTICIMKTLCIEILNLKISFSMPMDTSRSLILVSPNLAKRRRGRCAGHRIIWRQRYFFATPNHKICLMYLSSFRLFSNNATTKALIGTRWAFSFSRCYQVYHRTINQKRTISCSTSASHEDLHSSASPLNLTRTQLMSS